MVRHTKGTRSQLKPPLLSTPPFAPASCPRFGNLGTQGPGSWPHIPCLGIGALFGAAAAEKSSAATTSHKSEPDIFSLLQGLASQSNFDTFAQWAALRELCLDLINSLFSRIVRHVGLCDSAALS
jgi:hypothetical protein